MRTHVLVLAVVLAGMAGTRLLGQPAAATLMVTPSAASGEQGDVVLVTVDAARTLVRVEGTAFDQPVDFWQGPDATWRGLVGIDVEAAPGSHDVQLRGEDPQGHVLTGKATLTVQAREFATRRLSVQARFVDPPSGEIPRIQKEAKALAAVFTHSSESRYWHGPFLLPVPGRATSSFGRLTVLNGQPGSRHRGADFRASLGTPVHAPNAGRVVMAEDLYFTGNTVIMDHGLGLYSLFAHLSRVDVEEGALVDRGDRIGLAGSTGRVTGPHLHWTVRLRAAAVDPLFLVETLRGVTE